MIRFTESTVEDAALSWLQELDYSAAYGPEIAPGELAAERAGLGETFLTERLRTAFSQIETYKYQIPSIFHHNAIVVISDGVEARIGTIGSDKERFMPWRTVEGETVAPASMPQLEVLLRGVFDKRRFLDLVRHFIVFEELIALAKQMREAAQRGQGLGLSDDEVAFYDALEVNDSAVKVLGDENLRFIARELLKTIRENVSIDWTAKESVRAKLRVMVKRVLRKHGYPPDKQEKATQTVLQQAELLCADWAG